MIRGHVFNLISTQKSTRPIDSSVREVHLRFSRVFDNRGALQEQEGKREREREREKLMLHLFPPLNVYESLGVCGITRPAPRRENRITS